MVGEEFLQCFAAEMLHFTISIPRSLDYLGLEESKMAMLIFSNVPLSSYIYYRLGSSFNYLVTFGLRRLPYNTYSKRTLGEIAYIIISTLTAYQFFSSKVVHKLAYRYWNIALRNNMTSCCNWRTI